MGVRPSLFVTGETAATVTTKQNLPSKLFKAGEVISAGLTVVGVYSLTGTVGGTPKAYKADPSSGIKIRQIYFTASSAPLSGDVIAYDVLTVRLDTSTSVTGAKVYLSATPGAITLTRPTGVRPIIVGVVLNVATYANGGTVFLSNSVQARFDEAPTNGPVESLDFYIDITNGTGTPNYPITMPTGYSGKWDIYAVWVTGKALDALGTATLQNTGGTAISNAMPCAADRTTSYASSIDYTAGVVNAGDQVKVVYGGGSAVGRGRVWFKARPTS